MKNLEKQKKIENAINEISTCAISGAVGTYANIDPKIVFTCCKKKLKLNFLKQFLHK